MRLRRLFWVTLAYTAVFIPSLLIVLQFKEPLHLNVRKRFRSSSNLPIESDIFSSPKIERYFDFKQDERKPTENMPVNLIRGIKRPKPGYLTIGLCSVPRKNVSYLKETLHSLVGNMRAIDVNQTIIVLFLGSYNGDWMNQTLSFIDKDFSNEIQRGLLHVVQPSPYIYPNFTQITKRTYNDSVTRVRWRVKQNIDFAYLFGYCSKLTKYYIQVEDDIIAAANYVNEIQIFVNRYEASKKLWFRIDFCQLGFIGKLFKSNDLEKMKQYLLLFQEEKPSDLLMSDMTHIMTQFKPIHPVKSLFQHRGIVSSLVNKTQELVDRRFKEFKRNPPKAARKVFLYQRNITHRNPIATISTSIKVFKWFVPEKAYLAKLGDFFWGQTPLTDDYYQIRFNKTIRIREIIIKTGHPKTKMDILQNASLTVGNSVNTAGKCMDMEHIGVFDNGQVHIKQDMEVRCVVIVITANQTSWIIIQDIKLFT